METSSTSTTSPKLALCMIPEPLGVRSRGPAHDGWCWPPVEWPPCRRPLSASFPPVPRPIGPVEQPFPWGKKQDTRQRRALKRRQLHPRREGTLAVGLSCTWPSSEHTDAAPQEPANSHLWPRGGSDASPLGGAPSHVNSLEMASSHASSMMVPPRLHVASAPSVASRCAQRAS